MSEIKISDHKATSELFFPHVEVIDWQGAIPPVRINPVREKKRLLSEMDITKVSYKGQTIRIGVPRGVNRGIGCLPAELTVAAKGHVGAHAKGIVKKVDWDKRKIEFKGKHHPKVELPPDSGKAWEYMKRLLASDDPQGWVKFKNAKDANWTGHFTRRDPVTGAILANHPLTNLRCRIEANRKRGRQPKDAAPSVPIIRLVPFNKKMYDDYVAEERKAANVTAKAPPK